MGKRGKKERREELMWGLEPTNLTTGGNHGTLIRGRLKRGNDTTVNLIKILGGIRASTPRVHSGASGLPGVWKLIRRSSTGSVGWWDDMALLQGKLPFLPSASALFLESQINAQRLHLKSWWTEKLLTAWKTRKNCWIWENVGFVILRRT